ncbi:MAG: hypothetical protein NT051_02765 [Candidatus Micrarchaeota archaeon]|nr:hypothetical protein [Candidatus Micrarchaeota archaeon]
MDGGDDKLLSKMREKSAFFDFTSRYISVFCGVKTTINEPLDVEGYRLGGSSGEEQPRITANFGLPMCMYMHEVAHSWLARSKGIYSNLADYSFKGKSPSLLMGNAELYNSLTNVLSAIMTEERKFEKAACYFLPEGRKNRGATAKRLDALFGEPTLYDGRAPSWLSNILEESKTISKGSGGHPMDHFGEFFASTMATFTFDGEKAFARLNALLALRNEPEYASLADSFLTVLSFSAKYGNEMAGQMSKAGGSRLPEIQNLTKNMQKLQSILQEWEKAKQQPAGKTKIK